jgi:hypothetical protein
VQQWNLTLEQDLGHSIGARGSYTASHGQNLEAMVDLNQVPANPYGYFNPIPAPPATAACITDGGTLVSDHRPLSLLERDPERDQRRESNYNSGTVEVSRHSGKSLTFDASYTYTRDLSNAGGATPNAFAVAGGSFLTNRFHPGLDYGNVIYDRRHRFLVTYLYDLPLARAALAQLRLRAQPLVGDWQLAGVTVLQSGPFLTPYEQTSTRPTPTSSPPLGQARPDQLHTVSLYAQQRTTTQWLNPNAFPYLNLQTAAATALAASAMRPWAAWLVRARKSSRCR